MIDIWNHVDGTRQLRAVSGSLVRVVESQEQVATSQLVDTLAEQARLEELLEQTKPPHRRGTEKLHYLLATPFRYPPLRHGSRFGTRQEPGLFYGSCTSPTAFAETAYYRFVFWRDMQVPPPAGRLLTQHTLFGSRYRTDKGLKLQEAPFDDYGARLASPDNYRETQQLGRSMRAAGAEAFEYVSARDPAGGINVALYHPRALASRRPVYAQGWLCETQAERVVIANARNRESFVFGIELFLVSGRFPRPAA